MCIIYMVRLNSQERGPSYGHQIGGDDGKGREGKAREGKARKLTELTEPRGDRGEDASGRG